MDTVRSYRVKLTMYLENTGSFVSFSRGAYGLLRNADTAASSKIDFSIWSSGQDSAREQLLLCKLMGIELRIPSLDLPKST